MRFDTLLAMVSSGLYAPLLLMAGGFFLAVGGAIFLWLRRKKPAKAEPLAEQQAEPLSETEEPSPAVSPAPAASEGRRRRSLVGGAERDEGTPSGVTVADELETNESVEAEIEDAEENEVDDVAVSEPVDEPLEEEALATDTQEGAEFEDTELEPEWIEADTEPSEVTVAAGAAAAVAVSGDQELGDDTDKADPVSTAIDAARLHPIVFRQFLPQSPGEDGLSFYGGQPIGPSDFEWPRQEGVPLTFMMQWDCVKLSEQDATGLLPKDGALYCFLNLNWGTGEGDEHGHVFIHHSGPTEGWSVIPTPSDAPPIFGSQGKWGVTGCTPEIENADDYVPRVMPRFPFEPMVFDYPNGERSGDDEERSYWSDDSGTAEALLVLQKQGLDATGELPDVETPHEPFARPFPAFPHDFGAIRILAATMLEAVRRPPTYKLDRIFPDHSKEELDALFETWKGEAQELYLLGTQRPLGHPVEQQIADDIWQWVEARKDMIDLIFSSKTVPQSIELSLGVGSEALGAIPSELIEKAMSNHVLAREYMTNEDFDPDKHGTRNDYLKLSEERALERVRGVSGPTPAHIFGPPSYVQGYVEELIDDHVLLLELHGAEPGHHFGEGVLQYLITPEDLAAGRFDQVKSVISAY
ncbi:MAG: DUF1963 domain-containing protein [Pseudomonadota bacterium]